MPFRGRDIAIGRSVLWKQYICMFYYMISFITIKKRAGFNVFKGAVKLTYLRKISVDRFKTLLFMHIINTAV